jgi:hypothetical protein
MRLRASRRGIEKVEPIARSAASTMRNLYRSCKDRFPSHLSMGFIKVIKYKTVDNSVDMCIKDILGQTSFCL